MSYYYPTPSCDYIVSLKLYFVGNKIIIDESPIHITI